MGANNQNVSRKMFGNHGLSNPSHDPNLKTTGGMLYYQYDGLNTVSSVTDRHGDIIENYRYDVFGGIQTGITAPYNHNAYTSQRYDDKAGLIDMNARWYDPTVGRFLTQDTYRGDGMNPLTQNRYSYVLNNPVNMWDPTGHVAEELGRYNSSDPFNMDILETLNINGAFGFNLPNWVVNQSDYDTYEEQPTSFTYEDYTFIDYNPSIDHDSVAYMGKEKAGDNFFHYQYQGAFHEEWDYEMDLYLVQVFEGTPDFRKHLRSTADTFTRDSTLYWEIEVPAILASMDHQNIIQEVFGAGIRAEDLNPNRIIDYKSNTQSLILDGEADSQSEQIVHRNYGGMLGSLHVSNPAYKKPVKQNYRDSNGKCLYGEKYQRGSILGDLLHEQTKSCMSPGDAIIGGVILETVILPYGVINDITRISTGVDPITGQPLSGADKAWAWVGLIPAAGYVSDSRRAVNGVDTLSEISKLEKAAEVTGNVKNKPDFYVTPSGDVVPSTGYRYMNSKYAKQTLETNSAPGSYFGFDKFDSAKEAREALQISPEWSDVKLRGEFDTLQIIDDIRIPYNKGDTGDILEPITNSYPEFGKGGYRQVKTESKIYFKENGITLLED